MRVRLTRVVAVLLAGAALAACQGERVVMESADSTVRLVYRCDRVTPAARTADETALVRRYAVRATRHAARSQQVERVAAISRAYERSGTELEAVVVDYLCANADALSPPRIAFPDSGSVAPDFTLPVLGGATDPPRSLRLADLRGKVVLLDFWATWCGACKDTHPTVAALAREYDESDLVVLGIVFRDDPGRARAYFAREGGAGHPFVVDARATLRAPYGIRGLPRMFLIDRQGNVAAECLGCAVDGNLPPVFLKRLRALLDTPGG